jgi:MFS family permease
MLAHTHTHAHARTHTHLQVHDAKTDARTLAPRVRTRAPHLMPPPTAPNPPRYDDHLLQLFTSSLFLAAGTAAMIGSWTANRFGRKMTMLAGGLCFLVGTALVAAAVATPMLVVGRIVLGFGVGFACQARARALRRASAARPGAARPRGPPPWGRCRAVLRGQ